MLVKPCSNSEAPISDPILSGNLMANPELYKEYQGSLE
jgi:hypothetical protein